MPAAPTRLVSVLEAERPALVLGSTQPASDADTRACDDAGVEVVRRGSGGGAVLVEPGRVLWVDVVVPRPDALWEDDVGHAFGWLGRAWASALSSVGVAATVHAGALDQGRWGRKICFAGRGPGEVFDARGRKVVGMAQRRTRAGARFQCALPLRWDAERLVALLSWPSTDERDRAAGELARSVAPVTVDAGVLLEGFVAALSVLSVLGDGSRPR